MLSHSEAAGYTGKDGDDWSVFWLLDIKCAIVRYQVRSDPKPFLFSPSSFKYR